MCAGTQFRSGQIQIFSLYGIHRQNCIERCFSHFLNNMRRLCSHNYSLTVQETFTLIFAFSELRILNGPADNISRPFHNQSKKITLIYWCCQCASLFHDEGYLKSYNTCNIIFSFSTDKYDTKC